MKVVATYDYYTLDQAREIIERENRMKRRQNAKQALRRKRHMLRMVKQKAIGASMLLFAMAIPKILDGDATACLLVIPMGLYLILSRKEVI